ncbi:MULTISPECIES: helix-turn-helix transcriptional regulator [unclassified Lysinibacillus]|uniref:helix-turn-helix transcriptional regulator n=1 Tax=unclassified Lysinibacillus TaxID=2636778 RepID=UPI002011578C|nr:MULTISPECIES: helix-turn-helix transcriptional regulator [unclassified Lysinibacillus]MCL1695621.1 helix-turn-helix transcriptional regulator [Lysinibacillus sp. BPa_S21]MCL1700134.1 helix-turn-helix transcriptional regulator [Lysinibacillus sp. Bpr_S20]
MQTELTNTLHILRAKKKWSQKEVAERLGVSRQTINSIEANKYSPSLVLAFKIAKLFDVDINEVFQYDVLREENE